MKINAKWHSMNKMPNKPTLKERVKWHLDHSIHCSCRPIPSKLQEMIEK